MGLKSGIGEINQQYSRAGAGANGVLVFGAGVGAAATSPLESRYRTPSMPLLQVAI